MMTARRTSPRRTFCAAACMCAGASLSMSAIGRAFETTTVTSSPAGETRGGEQLLAEKPEETTRRRCQSLSICPRPTSSPAAKGEAGGGSAKGVIEFDDRPMPEAGRARAPGGARASESLF